MIRTCTIALLALLGTACAVSEDAVEADWQDFLADNQACETVDDCAVVYPGCPLGCYSPVSADAVNDANLEAARLISRYERGGRACAYDCDVEPDLVCEANTCEFAE